MAGLLITYVALNLMDGHGQPALLYIVPFTLGNFAAAATTVNHVGFQSGLKSVWPYDLQARITILSKIAESLSIGVRFQTACKGVYF
jgi:hypothetical protein